MRLNENRLNEIINENINKYIYEAWGNQGFGNNQNNNQDDNQNTEFNQDTVDANRKNRPQSSGNEIKKAAGKAALGAAGIGVGMGALGAMMGVAAGGMAGMTGILMTVGLGAIAVNLAGNLTALKRAKELKFPRTIYNAMEYAKFAAAERTEAQDMCRKIQENIQNAIAAYNQKFDKDLDTSDTSVFGNETAEFQDRGQTQNVNVDWDKDFTNVNAGQNESRIYEAFNSAEDANRQVTIKSAQDFLTDFQNITEQEALQLIQELKQQYKEAYGLWMQWTRYINVLVHMYGKMGLTWEVVINSNNSSNTKSIIKNFLQQKFGIGMDVNDYKPNNNGVSNLILRVKVLKYSYKAPGQKRAQDYVIFRDTKRNTYYGAPITKKFNGKKLIDGTQIQKEMPVSIVLTRNMLTGQTFDTSSGQTVNILNDKGIKSIKSTQNNGQRQMI